MRLVDSVYKQMKAKLTEAGLDVELVTQFFMVLSSFERALKRSGFEQANSDHLKASWERFVQHIEPEFMQRMETDRETRRAFEFLRDRNPNRAVRYENGETEYDAVPVKEDASDLMIAVKHLQGVRNNLFHGEKAQEGFFIKPTDPKYLTNCLILLNVFLELHPGIRESFFEGLNEPALLEELEVG